MKQYQYWQKDLETMPREQLVALHTPASPDYAARFGIVKSEGPSAASKTPSVRPTPRGGFASTLRP